MKFEQAFHAATPLKARCFWISWRSASVSQRHSGTRPPVHLSSRFLAAQSGRVFPESHERTPTCDMLKSLAAALTVMPFSSRKARSSLTAGVRASGCRFRLAMPKRNYTYDLDWSKSRKK